MEIRYTERRSIPLVLSVNQVAAAIGGSRSLVYRLVRDGELVPVRVGKRLRFHVTDIDGFLERNRLRRREVPRDEDVALPPAA